MLSTSTTGYLTFHKILSPNCKKTTLEISHINVKETLTLQNDYSPGPGCSNHR